MLFEYLDLIMETNSGISRQVYTKEDEKKQSVKLLSSPSSSGVGKQSSLSRNSSFAKAVIDKPPKSVTFNMEPGNVDEIELIERRKRSVKNGNVKSKARDSKLIEEEQKVDYVLVYEERGDVEGEELEKEEKRYEKREYFEKKLREKGLLLQHVDSDLNEVR